MIELNRISSKKVKIRYEKQENNDEISKIKTRIPISKTREDQE